MKGLMLKELYLYKGQLKIYLFLLGFYAIYAIAAKNISMLFIMIAILGVSGMLASFSVDSQCKWDIYALSTPIGRKKSVFSKYSMGFILISGITVLILIIAIIINQITGELSYMDILSMAYGTFATTILLMLLNMPFIYKLGVEKARYVYLIEAIIPTLLFMASRGSDIRLPQAETIERVLMFSPFVLVILSVLSIYISINIYEKTEF